MLVNDKISTNGKSQKATMKFSPSSSLHLEESSAISLNLQDLNVLMKQKEKEYQDELLISDAKRVHNFITDIQQRKRQQATQQKNDNRRKLRVEVSRYNSQTLRQFENEWKIKLSETVKQLQEVGFIAQQQHQVECQSVKQKIESIKNGQILQKIKFSREILQMQDQLNRLIKGHRYEQAEVVHKKLQKIKTNQMKQFLQQSVQKQRQRLFRIKQRQQKQKQILIDKLSDIYINQERRHALEAQKLVKNMRTYEIDMGKISHAINRKSRQHSNRVQYEDNMSSKNKDSSILSILEIKEIKDMKEYPQKDHSNNQ